MTIYQAIGDTVAVRECDERIRLYQGKYSGISGIRSVNIDMEQALELSRQGYKWSGHTHPGLDENCFMSSLGDVFVLKAFKQKRSAIYNSKGQFQIFESGD